MATLKKKFPSEPMTMILNIHNDQQYPISVRVWQQMKDKYKSVYVEVQQPKVPPEVKALKEKQAAVVEETAPAEELETTKPPETSSE